MSHYTLEPVGVPFNPRQIPTPSRYRSWLIRPTLLNTIAGIELIAELHANALTGIDRFIGFQLALNPDLIGGV